jgi:hypothetical protein
MLLRNLVFAPVLAAFLAFGSAARADIWSYSFTDMGVDYTLTFESLSGNVGTYQLTLDTAGYAGPSGAYLDSVAIKAWGGQATDFQLISFEEGSTPGDISDWTVSGGPIGGGPAFNTGCKDRSGAAVCTEAGTKGEYAVDSSTYTFTFEVTANSFLMTPEGTRIAAGYADQNGRGAGYGKTSVIATAVAPVPEPEIYAMMLVGLALMIFFVTRRRMPQPAAA